MAVSEDGPNALQSAMPAIAPARQIHSHNDIISLTPGTQPARAIIALKMTCVPKTGAMIASGASVSATVESVNSEPVLMTKPSHQRHRLHSGRPTSTSADRFMMTSATDEMSADSAARKIPMRACTSTPPEEPPGGLQRLRKVISVAFVALQRALVTLVALQRSVRFMSRNVHCVPLVMLVPMACTPSARRSVYRSSESSGREESSTS